MASEGTLRRVITEQIIVGDNRGTRTITMSRPESKNRLTQDMYRAMSAAIASAQSNAAVRCLVLTGRSGAFTAGSHNDDGARSAPPASGEFLQTLKDNRKPILAAVDGPAFGMGATMAFLCDFVVAGATAIFSFPAVARDRASDEAAGLLLSRTIGRQRAFSMLVMGHPMSAEEAFKAGLVNLVVSPGHAIIEAHKIAEEIGALPAETVAVSRGLLKPQGE